MCTSMIQHLKWFTLVIHLDIRARMCMGVWLFMVQDIIIIPGMEYIITHILLHGDIKCTIIRGPVGDFHGV